eukprot:scaffold16017_cov183-Amphora_coffeaeformis.AAC.4
MSCRSNRPGSIVVVTTLQWHFGHAAVTDYARPAVGGETNKDNNAAESWVRTALRIFKCKGSSVAIVVSYYEVRYGVPVLTMAVGV